MTEGQFAVIAAWLVTIAILIGPPWRAVVLFVVVLGSMIAYEWISDRLRRRRGDRRDAYKALLDRTEPR